MLKSLEAMMNLCKYNQSEVKVQIQNQNQVQYIQINIRYL